jgi:glycosyltransferase involved in cell wall biosynthesis
MSCGTPVIGFDRGAVKELVVDGKTGFVVNPEEGIAGLKTALQKLSMIQSQDCRAHVEKHFSLETMITNYENFYQTVTAAMPKYTARGTTRAG